MVWNSHLLKNFPQFIVIHIVKGFGIVNEAEIGVFLELACFFDDPADVGNLISGSSAFSKTSLNIWKFTIDGETVETMSDFILGGSKITADGDCSHELKRHLPLGRRRQWHPTPVLLPGKSHGQRSLVGCSPWGR